MSGRSTRRQRASSSSPASPTRRRGRTGQPGRVAETGRPEARRPRWILGLGGLFIVSLLWRLAYLGRLAQSPFAGSLTEDARIYWNWSGYLLHAGPLGTEPFFFGPLYPYALALARLVLGNSIRSVLILQAVGGSLAVVLLADAARRLTRPAAGLIVGALLCFYEMSVFFEGLVLMEAMLYLLEAALLWYVVRAGGRLRGIWPAVLVGVLIGLLTVGRATNGLLVLPAALLLLSWRESGRRASGRTAAMLGGVLVAVAPFTVRNALVIHEWMPLTYNGGYNLYVGNNPQATGGWVPIAGTALRMGTTGRDGGTELDGRDFLESRLGHPFGPTESSRYWTGLAARYIRDHPGRAIRLTLRKTAMLWSHREYPQIENVDVYRRVAGPVGIPLVGSFALIGALALAGAWFAWSSGASARFLVGYLVTLTAGVAPFFVTDRFRYHLVPAAALLVAIVIERLSNTLRARRPRELLTIAALVLAGAALTHLPTPSMSAERRAWGIASDIGSRWLERGRPDLALPLLEEAADGETREAARHAPGAATRDERAQLHYEYGAALLQVGRARESLPWLERAAREVPDYPLFAQRLAEAYQVAGRAAAAESLRSRLGSLPEGAGLDRSAEAWRAAQRGDLEAAAELFGAAVRENPRLFDAWGGLVRAELQLNQPAAAESSLMRAKAAGLPATSYWAHRAAIAAVSHQYDVAEDALRRVPDDELAGDPALRALVDATHRILSRRPALK